MQINFIGIKTIARRECIKFLTTSVQSLAGPWLSALLYILIFGKIIGSRVTFYEGRFSYLAFVFPGVLALNIIVGAFRQSTFSLYFQRFSGAIEEALVAPLSTFDLMTGYIIGAITRGLVIGSGIYLIAVAFNIGRILFFGQFIIYAVLIALTFGFFGLIVALWAESWEQLSIFDIFIITPLSFLGGLFTSMDMIAVKYQWLIRVNPFFYYIDAIRYSMIGIQESNPWVRLSMTTGILMVSMIWASALFARGYKLKP